MEHISYRHAVSFCDVTQVGDMRGRPRTYMTGAERERAYRDRKKAQEAAAAQKASKLSQQVERKADRVKQLQAQVTRLKRALEKQRQGAEAARLLAQDLAQARYSAMF